MANSDVEIKAVWDEKGSIGSDRDHYVFPTGSDRVEVAKHSAITGGFYIKKGHDVPETITITLTGRT